MNTKKLIEKITENWAVKIICFSLAILIYIFHQVSLLEKKTFAIPLNVVADGLVVPITELPPYIKVTVRTNPEVAASVSAAGLVAYIYLNDITEPGDYTVPVNIKLPPELMPIDPLEVFVKPDTFDVKLDKKVQKYIPVQPLLSGEPVHGYSVSSVSVVPSSVKALGPASVIEKVECIYTEKVNIKGASKGLSSTVKLDNPISSVKTISESDYRVTVSISPEKTTNSFNRITPRILNLNEKFIIETPIPQVSFKIEGAVFAIEKYNVSDSTVTINCASVSSAGSYELPVFYSVPAGISVVEKSLEKIKINVALKNPEKTEGGEKIKVDILDNFDDKTGGTTEVDGKSGNDATSTEANGKGEGE